MSHQQQKSGEGTWQGANSAASFQLTPASIYGGSFPSKQIEQPDVLRTLQELGIQYQERGDELGIACPWCDFDGTRDGSVSINAITGLGKCQHANRCSQGGFNVYELIKFYRPLSKPVDKAYGGLSTADVLDCLAAQYGLKRADFEAYGCKIEKAKFGDIPQALDVVAYPLLGLSGKPNSKLKSVMRFLEGKAVNAPAGKRLCRLRTKGTGFFPAEAFEKAGPFIITAGEEKVLALQSLGINALQYSAGENSLSHNAARYLVDANLKDVIIWMDSDEAGRKGTDLAARRMLEAGATRVRTVQWPEGLSAGWDVNDQLKADGPSSIHALLATAADFGTKTPQQNPSAKQEPVPVSLAKLLRTEFKPINWAVVDLIPEGLSILAGPPKAGKTLLVTELALCVGTGTPFLGFETRAGNVLVLDAETSMAQIRRRLTTMGLDFDTAAVEVLSTPPGWQLDECGLAWLTHYAETHPELRLVIADTLERLVPHPSNGRQDAYQATVARIAPLQKWAQSQGIPVMCVHHTGKQPTESKEAFDSMSGSRGLTGTAETLYTLRRHEDEVYRLTIQSRHMKEADFAINRNGVRWKLLGEFESVSVSEERREIMEYFHANPETNVKALAEALGIDYENAKKSVQRAAKAGCLKRTSRGCYILSPEYEKLFGPLSPESPESPTDFLDSDIGLLGDKGTVGTGEAEI